jgi:hypothetical protein
MSTEASSLSKCITEYSRAVREDDLERAYRNILAALTDFKTGWETAHPADSVGALYQGYLDMSFVAVAPAVFGQRRLKISLVFLHAEGIFSLWLTAGNRAIQAETSAALKNKPLGTYALCPLNFGVDAIIACDVPPPYDFDDSAVLTAHLQRTAEAFLADMVALLEH